MVARREQLIIIDIDGKVKAKRDFYVSIFWRENRSNKNIKLGAKSPERQIYIIQLVFVFFLLQLSRSFEYYRPPRNIIKPGRARL